MVGSAFGVGINKRDVTLDADGENLTVIFRGANNAGIKSNGIAWTAGGVTTSGANQTAFLEQLEKQGLVIVDNATVVTPVYTS